MPRQIGAGAAFGAIVLLGAQNGGFFADSWGWVGVPLLLLAGGALFVQPEMTLSRSQVLWLGGLALLTAWTASSALWAPDAGAPVVEAERVVVYLAAASAVVVLGTRAATTYAVLAATFVLSAWAVVDKLAGHRAPRLEGPIGYANGLGLVAATGTLLAAGLARRRPALLATLVVFLPTLYLTYSRGALLALIGGLIVLGGLAIRTHLRLLATGVIVIVALAGLALVVGHHGAAQSTGNVSGRLSSLSGNGRGDYWRVALDQFRAHPALGGGAGTWDRWWLARRPNANGALDAHSLYLETLAELGPFGLVLLIATLAIPLVSLGRARRDDWARACAAAYVALLVQAALDWTWELPAVALCGLLCGTALVAAEPLGRVVRLTAAVPAAAALAAVVFVLQVGNTALRSAQTAVDAGNTVAAAGDARRAIAWQPWTSQPRLVLGEAQLAAGNIAAAARSFARVTHDDPGNAEAWYQLALATSGARRNLALRRAILLDPHGPAAALR